MDLVGRPQHLVPIGLVGHGQAGAEDPDRIPEGVGPVGAADLYLPRAGSGVIGLPILGPDLDPAEPVVLERRQIGIGQVEAGGRVGQGHGQIQAFGAGLDGEGSGPGALDGVGPAGKVHLVGGQRDAAGHRRRAVKLHLVGGHRQAPAAQNRQPGPEGHRAAGRDGDIAAHGDRQVEHHVRGIRDEEPLKGIDAPQRTVEGDGRPRAQGQGVVPGQTVTVEGLLKVDRIVAGRHGHRPVHLYRIVVSDRPGLIDGRIMGRGGISRAVDGQRSIVRPPDGPVDVRVTARARVRQHQRVAEGHDAGRVVRITHLDAVRPAVAAENEGVEPFGQIIELCLIKVHVRGAVQKVADHDGVVRPEGADGQSPPLALDRPAHAHVPGDHGQIPAAAHHQLAHLDGLPHADEPAAARDQGVGNSALPQPGGAHSDQMHGLGAQALNEDLGRIHHQGFGADARPGFGLADPAHGRDPQRPRGANIRHHRITHGPSCPRGLHRSCRGEKGQIAGGRIHRGRKGDVPPVAGQIHVAARGGDRRVHRDPARGPVGMEGHGARRRVNPRPAHRHRAAGGDRNRPGADLGQPLDGEPVQFVDEHRPAQAVGHDEIRHLDPQPRPLADAGGRLHVQGAVRGHHCSTGQRTRDGPGLAGDTHHVGPVHRYTAQGHVARGLQDHRPAAGVHRGTRVHGKAAAVRIQGQGSAVYRHIRRQDNAAARGHRRVTAGSVLHQPGHSHIIGVSNRHGAAGLNVQAFRIHLTGDPAAGDQGHITSARIHRLAIGHRDRTRGVQGHIPLGRHVRHHLDVPFGINVEAPLRERPEVHRIGDGQARGVLQGQPTARDLEDHGGDIEVLQDQVTGGLHPQGPRGDGTAHAQVPDALQDHRPARAHVDVGRDHQVAVRPKRHALSVGGPQGDHAQIARHVQVHIARHRRGGHEHVVAVHVSRNPARGHLRGAETLARGGLYLQAAHDPVRVLEGDRVGEDVQVLIRRGLQDLAVGIQEHGPRGLLQALARGGLHPVHQDVAARFEGDVAGQVRRHQGCGQGPARGDLHRTVLRGHARKRHPFRLPDGDPAGAGHVRRDGVHHGAKGHALDRGHRKVRGHEHRGRIHAHAQGLDGQIPCRGDDPAGKRQGPGHIQVHRLGPAIARQAAQEPGDRKGPALGDVDGPGRPDLEPARSHLGPVLDLHVAAGIHLDVGCVVGRVDRAGHIPHMAAQVIDRAAVGHHKILAVGRGVQRAAAVGCVRKVGDHLGAAHSGHVGPLEHELAVDLADEVMVGVGVVEHPVAGIGLVGVHPETGALVVDRAADAACAPGQDLHLGHVAAGLVAPDDARHVDVGVRVKCHPVRSR